MSNPTLPEPIAAYFAAAQNNTEAFAHCFTAQAVVKDDGHTHTGIDAIKAWQDAASVQYNATTTPFAVEREDGLQVVRTHVAGNFPGSPVDLTYRFRLERGLIASLEISV